MKTVVVPSTGNADLIENYSLINEIFPGEPIHYIFLDIRPIPDSYNDLLTICRDGKAKGNFKAETCEAVATLQSCGHNCTATVDHIYGDSVPVFRNYLEYCEANLVIFDQAQLTGHPHFRQQEILTMVLRSGVEMIYIPYPPTKEKPGTMNVVNRPTPLAVAKKSQKVLNTATGDFDSAVLTKGAPTSVVVRYSSVDKMLNDLQGRVLLDAILVQQASRIRRYFMKQSQIQQKLHESRKEVLWLKN